MKQKRDFSDQELYEFRTIINYLRGLTQNGIFSEITHPITKILDEAIDFSWYMYDVQEFPEIVRLTINKKILGSNKRIHDINHLKYPPSHLVKSYGRCNQPGQSILYASYGLLSILSEMKPELGDLITISTWRSLDNATLTFCPVFKNQPPDGTINLTSQRYEKHFQNLLKELPKNAAIAVEFLNQFVADAFSKRFQHNSNDINYLVSAYFANQMLYKYKEHNIEAIFYPSVQQKLAFENLAIKPEVFDAKYRLVSVKEDIVVKTPRDGDGGYFQQGISKCENFDFDNDTILWTDKFHQTDESMTEYTKVGYDFS
ncbi:hypothetical protein [Pedobacter panaciterrae]